MWLFIADAFPPLAEDMRSIAPTATRLSRIVNVRANMSWQYLFLILIGRER